MVVELQDITQLKNFAGAQRTAIVTDPLRGGVFNWSSEALTDDDGTIFTATGVGEGFWVRDFNPEQGLNVKWFGALGDGVTDDVTSIKAALLKAKNGNIKDIYFPTGTYMISETLYLSSGAKMFGDGMTLSIIKNHADAVTGLDLITPQDGAVTNPDYWTLRTMIATEGTDYTINTRVENVIIEDIGVNWNGIATGINSVVPILIGRADFSHIRRVKIFDALPSDLEDVNEERQGLSILFAFSEDCSLSDSWVGASDYESVSVRYLSKRITISNNDVISNKPLTYHWQTHLLQVARPTSVIASLEAQYGETVCQDIFIKNNRFHLESNCLHACTAHTTEGFYLQNNYTKFYNGNVAWGFKSFENTRDILVENNVFDATDGGMNEFQQAVGNSVPRYGVNFISLNQIQTTSNEVSNAVINGNLIMYKNTVAAVTSPPAGGTSSVPLGYVNPFIGGFASNGTNVTISNNVINIDGYDDYAKPVFGIKGDAINVVGNTVRLSNPLETITSAGFKFLHIGGGKGINVDNNVVTGTSLGKGTVVDDVSFEDIKIVPVNYNCTVVGDILTTGLASQNEITVLPLTINSTKADVNGNIAITIPTVDATPTDGSPNAVSSNGVFDALALKVTTPASTGYPYWNGGTATYVTGSSATVIRGDGVTVARNPLVFQNATLPSSPVPSTVAVALGDTVETIVNKLLGQLGLRANLVGTSDIEITDTTKGVILKSPDGTRYRITVANGGTLVVTAV